MFRKLSLGLLLVILSGCTSGDIGYTDIGVTHVGKVKNLPDTKIEVTQHKAP